MHYGCFQAWDQRPHFVAEYNRLLGLRVWVDGMRHPMADDGTATTVSVSH